MSSSTPRGLYNFIRDIRNCTSKDDEKKRVMLELGNVRTKFKGEKLSVYERKKYVWKLLYIYMLGYDVEFGHMEAVSLISSPKYAEKQVGYMVTSVLLNEHHEFLRLVINSIRNDVISRNDAFQSLGLVLVSNVGGREFAESLAVDVQRLLVTGAVRPVVRKKAALCMLRLFRRNPDVLNKEELADVIPTLLEERDHGLLTSVLSFLHGLAAADPIAFRGCVPRLVRLLDRLVREQDVPQDYMYYGLPSPWMQVKILRILQLYPLGEDPSLGGAVSALVQRVIAQGAEHSKTGNRNNATQAVLFEAVGMVTLLERDRDLVEQMAVQLGRFIGAKEPNTRYLGLDSMARLAALPQVAIAVKRNQKQIAESLHDPDISIRRRALDLLYGMCDAGNAESVVQELLSYLVLSDFAIREELVLKTAILAEKFAPTQRWYVDVVLELMDKAGDFVSDDIWHRVVQIVTNQTDLQAYAAEAVLGKLRGGSTHESMLKVCGYLLGEFGHRLQGTQPVEYFGLLQQRFAACSLPTKALLLSAYAKMVTHTSEPAFVDAVSAVFQRYHAYADVELQQRAVEYFSLAQLHGATLKEVLAEMPKFTIRPSALERKVDGDASRGDSAANAPPALALPSTPVAAAPPPRPADTTRDLLGDLLESAAPPPPQSIGLSGLDALVGGYGSTPAVTSAPAPVPPPAAADAALFRKLCVTDQGLLYEDATLQIGCVLELREAQGRLSLFLGNKQAQALQGLRVEVASTAAVAIQDVAGVPPSLAPQQQAQVLIMVTCRAAAPPGSAPTATISYHLGGAPVSFALPLPLVTTKFLVPAPAMPPAQFYESWRVLAGPPQKLEAVLQVAAGLRGWQDALSGLRLTVLPGLDPNPSNLFAASCLGAAAGPLVAVRVESDAANPTQFRLTVASANPDLAAAVQALLRAAL